MKQATAFILCLVSLLFLTACSSKPKPRIYRNREEKEAHQNLAINDELLELMDGTAEDVFAYFHHAPTYGEVPPGIIGSTFQDDSIIIRYMHKDGVPLAGLFDWNDNTAQPMIPPSELLVGWITLKGPANKKLFGAETLSYEMANELFQQEVEMKMYNDPDLNETICATTYEYENLEIVLTFEPDPHTKEYLLVETNIKSLE